MKRMIGVLSLVFLTGMIVLPGTSALLYGAETGGGNVWDQFLDPKPYSGISLVGPLSIYYEYIEDLDNSCPDDVLTYMFYTVRLNKDDNKKKMQLYTFQGTTATCLKDFFSQGIAIRNFFETVVIPGIFAEGFTSWKWKSIDKAQYNYDLLNTGFVADIELFVKRK
jgi:hypothetical protein